MSTSNTNLSAEECRLPMSIQETYFDCNAQFPSPDHVFAETPAEMHLSLITPSSTLTSKVNVAIQTNVSFPDILPEQMQTALDAYTITPECNELMKPCSEVVKDNPEDCNCFLQKLIDTYLPLPLSIMSDDFELNFEKTSTEELMNIMIDNEIVDLQSLPFNLLSPLSSSCDNELEYETKKSNVEMNNFDDIVLVEPQPFPINLPSPPHSDCDKELGYESKKSNEEINNFDDIVLVEPQPFAINLPSPPHSDCDKELGCESEPSRSEEVENDFDDIELVEPQPFLLIFPSPPSSDCDSELVDSEDIMGNERDINITEPTCHPDNEV